VTCDRPIDRTRLPDPGFAILDPDGRPVRDGQPGDWVVLRLWAGLMRAVEALDEDPTAYHWSRHPGHYATDDVARRTPAGDVEVLGRLDEVVSVSGQLVSLSEVREALLEQPFVAGPRSSSGRTPGSAVRSRLPWS
jgi:acetyl-CoA synthetase